jgi:hypothetical protein
MFEPSVRSKRAPRLEHESSEPAFKSSGSIVHNCPPPKDKDTETDVSQAEHRQEDEEVKRGTTTYGTKTSLVGWSRNQIPDSRNETVKSNNIIVGTFNENSPCVDSGRSTREWHWCTIDSEI